MNGCGANGGMNFSLIFKKLSELPYFIPEKYMKLEVELELICDDHDEDYNVGGTWFDRLLADIRLFQRFKERMKWVDDWRVRWGLPTLAFLGVRFFGSKSFSFTH